VHVRAGPGEVDGGDGADRWPALVADLLALRRPLGVGVDLDRPQEVVVDAIAAAPGDQVLGRLAHDLGVAPGDGGARR
nr:hypothetical protein [Acidimicrobiia bacterium]